MLILPNIVGDPRRISLIKIRLLISGNVASVALNLDGGQLRHLALTMNA